MNFSEVMSRVTGFSVPVFGISWNPPAAEITVAKQLIIFLEDRRVLYNDYELEMPEHYAMSVMKIRDYLTDLLKSLPSGSELEEHIRPMRNACRNFMNTVEDKPKHRLIMTNGFTGGPESWVFCTALGKLRADLGTRIGAIAVMHGLDVEDDLARILPPDSK